MTLNSDLSSGTSSGNIDTFHTIQLTPSTQFDIDHVEVRKFRKLAYIYELHKPPFVSVPSKILFELQSSMAKFDTLLTLLECI